MALIALFSRDRAARHRWGTALQRIHDVMESPSWDRLTDTVREEPVTGVVVDVGSLGGVGGALGSVHRFRSTYPGLATVVVAPSHRDPSSLFRLGRLGVGELVLAGVEAGTDHLVRSVTQALEHGAVARVLRSVSPYVPPRELSAVRRALEGVHRDWSAEEFAERVGFSRPFLSERLKEWGLPSVGRLLLWTRLLHAGYWLPEPGRTAESVSRQLGYANGAVFRRALRQRLERTPTEVIDEGGFGFVLGRFLDECDFGATATERRFSAA